jgi:8-oxo-dGTP diphosphatase
MALLLVRHAYAGERSSWEGCSDSARPLDDIGHEQATELARVLAELPIETIISSPAVRCTQTVAPLATKVGVPLRLDARLGEPGEVRAIAALVAECPDWSVLCTHGRELDAILDVAMSHGACVVAPRCLSKAVTWILERTDAGAIVSARAEPCSVVAPS